MSTLDSERERLIQAVQQCVVQCEHCASLATGLRDTETCIRLCRDTAVLCRAAEELLARSSSFERLALLAAVLAGESCAEQCEYHPGEFFEDCARACRKLKKVAHGIGADILATSEDFRGSATGPALLGLVGPDSEPRRSD